MIKSLGVRIIVHATEDDKRIKSAAEKLFGVGFSTETYMGHWDNPITMMSAKIKGGVLLEEIKKSLIIENFETQSGDGSFFFRLSKSGVLRGVFESGDDVRIKVKLRVPKGQTVSTYMETFWKGKVL
ncbi:MAG: hypothetical protein GOV01_03190 [Candidatus Altiarchaeota archaeon]|nr:hypothetical protein [Candidatus Altiarchaeota archaeon]